MKKFIVICSIFLAFNAVAAQDEIKPDNADYLRGALHYIYFWYLDSEHFFEYDQDKNLEILVKKIDYVKDKNNNSEQYNLIIPDLNTDVVTSLEEVSGSNAYITKIWAGRIMYNCIVDGSEIVIQPSSNNNNN